MNRTHEFANVYNDFQDTSANIKKYAIDNAAYKEVIHGTTKTIERRAIVTLHDINEEKFITKKIDEWSEARDALHKLSPERFPLNSELFNPAPLVIDNVRSGQIYINEATNSRIYSAVNLINRLERMESSYLNKPESSIYEDHIETIRKELEYFKEHINDKFRLRSTGYTEIIVYLSFNNGEKSKLKVHDSGIFLSATNGIRATICQPDQAPQATTRQKRASLYSHLTPITTCLPLTGHLYLESDKIALDNEMKRNKERMNYN